MKHKRVNILSLLSSGLLIYVIIGSIMRTTDATGHIVIPKNIFQLFLNINRGNFDLITLIIPLLISITTISIIVKTLNTSMLSNMIMRNKYKNILKNEIKGIYVEGLKIYVIPIIIVFVIGLIVFPKSILLSFKYFGGTSIYNIVFILLYILKCSLYTILLVNLTIIFYYLIANKIFTVILTELFIYVYSFIVVLPSNIYTNYLIQTGDNFKPNFLSKILNNLEILGSLSLNGYPVIEIINLLLLSLISFFIMKKIYGNKERVVMRFD